MRSRARMRFADYFNPVDFSHVNWLQGHKSTLLTGERVEPLPLRGFETAVEDDTDAHDEQAAVDIRNTAREMRRELAPIDEEEPVLRPTSEWLARDGTEGTFSDLAPFLSAREPLRGARGDHSDVLEAQGVTLQPSRSPNDPLVRSLLQEHADGIDKRSAREPTSSPYSQQPQTLEYDPERGSPKFLEVMRRNRDGVIQFVPIRRLEDRGHWEKGRWVTDPYDLGFIVTDGGTRVTAKKHLGTEPRYRSNCHGYVFADGEYWIEPEEVDKILVGDAYAQLNLREDSLRPGDVVIYRDERGNAFHSAVVIGRDSRTGDVVVEGIRGTYDVEPHRSSIYRQTDIMRDKMHRFEVWRRPRNDNRRRRRK